MFDVLFLLRIEISFTGKKKTFFVFEYARMQSKNYVQLGFVREFAKMAPLAM